MSNLPPVRSRSDLYRDGAVLNELSEMACDRFDDFLSWFNLNLKKNGKPYVGGCPIHGSHKNNSLNVYAGFAEGTVRGNWSCHTNPHCEKTFNRFSLIGLTRGLLSHDAFGWTQEGDRTVKTAEAVDELCKCLGVDLGDVRVDPKKELRRKVVRRAEILTPAGRPTNELCTVDAFRRCHAIPAPYFLRRGFSPEVLEHFMVGENISASSPNRGRAIIPIFDEGVIVGALSRSRHDECPRCEFNHPEGWPCLPKDCEEKRYLRWVVEPPGFNDKHYLYGLWHARKTVLQSKCVVLVEGAGDVWRSWEAGIRNAVGLMGCKLTTSQEILLEQCSPRHIIVMTDNDPPGEQAFGMVEKFARRLCKVHRLRPEGKDLGEMTATAVETLYRAKIESLMG